MTNYFLHPRFYADISSNVRGSFELTRPSNKASWTSWTRESYFFGNSCKKVKEVGNIAKSQLLQLYRDTMPVNSIQELVERHDLKNALSNGGLRILEEHDVPRIYMDDVLEGEIAIQYSQSMRSLNNLALGIGAYNADQGKSLQGGSMAETLQAMLDDNSVDLRLSTEVFGFRRFNATTWIVASRKQGTSSQPEYNMFDAVIVAAPFFPNDFEFENTKVRTTPRYIDYVNQHITWFTSSVEPDRDALGINATSPFPDRVIMRAPRSWPHPRGGQGFVEISDLGVISHRNTRVDQHLYRVLSEGRLEDRHLVVLLNGESPSWVGRHEIKTAYPKLYTRLDFPPIVFDDGFWSPLSIETVGTSVELSAWAGKNVASLVVAELAKRADD